MSTLAGVQYSYHEYTGDTIMSVDDIMSTAGCSVHREDTISILGIP